MDITSIGECMIEFYAEPDLGSDVYVRGFGGDTLNTIVAASRLGSSVAYLTRLGDDDFSKYLLNAWKKENIDISQVKQVKNGQAGIYFINLDDQGERGFQYYRKGSAASTLQLKDFDLAFIKETKLLYSSGITQALSECNRQTIKYLFHRFKDNHPAGGIIAYDPNYREKLWLNRSHKAKEAQEEILPFIDLVLPSFPADASLIKVQSPEEMIGYYGEHGIKRTVVKLGEKGCLYTEDGGKTIHRVPALQVDRVVDTTGAGDAFNGGVLNGLVNNYPVKKAIKLGITVAGLKIQGRGAISSLPTMKEVNRYWKI